MNLTFKGFLRLYCRQLTGLETDSLRRLINATATDAPAAAEAVMVFATVQNKAAYAVELAKGTILSKNYQSFYKLIQEYDSLEKVLQSKNAPERYKKVWKAYISKRYSIKDDRRIIALMREKTLQALSKNKASLYSICKQLSLNEGNFYAYINGGDTSKVSRDTARRIMEAVS